MYESKKNDKYNRHEMKFYYNGVNCKMEIPLIQSKRQCQKVLKY